MPPSKSHTKIGERDRSTIIISCCRCSSLSRSAVSARRRSVMSTNGRHHPVNLVIYRPVGPDADEVPAAVAAFHLALHGGQVAQHGPGIFGQPVIGKLVRKVGDR